MKSAVLWRQSHHHSHVTASQLMNARDFAGGCRSCITMTARNLPPWGPHEAGIGPGFTIASSTWSVLEPKASTTTLKFTLLPSCLSKPHTSREISPCQTKEPISYFKKEIKAGHSIGRLPSPSETGLQHSSLLLLQYLGLELLHKLAISILAARRHLPPTERRAKNTICTILLSDTKVNYCLPKQITLSPIKGRLLLVTVSRIYDCVETKSLMYKQ